MADNAYKQYRRKQIAELADWQPGFDMTGVSVSDADKAAGSPRAGDKIARNPANHADRWLVAAGYFEVNFEPMTATPSELPGLPEEPRREDYVLDYLYFVDLRKYIDALRSRLVEQGEEIERLKRDRDAIVDETNW
jgi:hypothetical protein